MKLSRRALLADIGTYVAYAVIFLFFAGPLLWLVSLSIRNSSEIFVSDLRLLPANPDAGELYAASSTTRSSRAICGTD